MGRKRRVITGEIEAEAIMKNFIMKKRRWDKNRPIKYERVRVMMEGTNKFRRGGRPSVHSRIFRELSIREKRRLREKRLKELRRKREEEFRLLNDMKLDENHKIILSDKELGIKRDSRLDSDSIDLSEYKRLLLEGLVFINDLLIKIDNDEFDTNEIISYMDRVEGLISGNKKKSKRKVKIDINILDKETED